MPTILVADDNSNIQKMVAQALNDHGIDVVAVGNGEAAVRRLPDLKPDVVLADVFMPVRNGYEVCEFVKKDPQLAHIPVILLIGAFDPLDEKEAHRVGANGVLKKPFVPPDPLIAMVSGLVAGAEKHGASKSLPTRETKSELRPATNQAHPPISIPFQPSEAELRGEPEPEPDEFPVAHGPMSLREEDLNSEPESAQKAEESTEERWAQPASDWQRRDSMSLEVPSEISAPQNFYGETGLETEAQAPVAPAGIETAGVLEHDFTRLHQETQIESNEPIAADLKQISDEPSAAVELAPGAADWMDMMSAPSEFTTEPAEDFVNEEVIKNLVPSAGVSPEPPAEMLWQPAVIAEQHAHSLISAETKSDHPRLEELVGPAEIPYSPTPVAYEPSPYVPAIHLVDPAASLPVRVHPLREIPPAAKPSAPAPEASASAHVLFFPDPQPVDSATVDSVVTKVLDKIEPKLREFLSREIVRPLAESLLQRDKEKK